MCACRARPWVHVWDYVRVCVQETELVQAKDRAQQQLRQKVNSVNCTMCHVTRGPPDCRRLSLKNS